MNNYSSGNTVVDEVGKLNLSGNIIPQAWYQTIVKENGKPDLRAIIFLSDIVYWYRPKEIRDEATGITVGFKKRMKKDLLQRSYQQLSDQFGCSKREAQATIVALEKFGVIKRVFCTEIYKGVRSNNIMYLSLNVEVLKILTYPQESTLLQKKETAIPKKRHRVSQNKAIAPTKKGETNTKTSTEISSKNINQSIIDKKSEEMIKKELIEKHKLHVICMEDANALIYAIKFLCKLDTCFDEDYFSDPAKQIVFKKSVQALTEMASGLNPKYDSLEIIEKINETIKSDERHDLFTFIDEVSRSYIEKCSKTKMTHHKSYLEAAIYNGFGTYRLQYESNIRKLTFS